jgi:hypothetical protein
MSATRIRLATAPGMPLPTLKRKLGVDNIGFYCGECGEFYAFAIEVPADRVVEFTADGPVLTKCPFCKAEVDRRVSEIKRLVLTEANKRAALS